MKQWDIFLSHASEDKEAVALPLTAALVRSGVRVWLDRFEIRLGDSIRAKIDEGLAMSRFGAVVLSEVFFQKLWTNRELDGLFARDAVLPIWHGVDEKVVARYSPLLAGKAAVSTREGIESVAHRIVDRLYVLGDATSPAAPGLSRKLATLLTGSSSVADIATFLAEHPTILSRAFAIHKGDFLRSQIRLAGEVVDYAVGTFQPTLGRLDDWRLVFFGRPDDSLMDGKVPSPELKMLMDRADAIRSWMSRNLEAARTVLPAIKGTFRAIVVTGRRPQPGSAKGATLAELNDELMGTTVRTYDWLLDATMEIEAGEERHD